MQCKLECGHAEREAGWLTALQYSQRFDSSFPSPDIKICFSLHLVFNKFETTVAVKGHDASCKLVTFDKSSSRLESSQ